MIKFNQNAWLKPYTEERPFQADKYCSFWKNNEKCEKTEILNL